VNLFTWWVKPEQENTSLLKTLYGELPLKNGTANVAGFDLKDLTWKTVPFLR